MSELNLRVAIVGAGPAGLYAAGQLLEQHDHTIEVDLFDRLPTPHGLVRAGVAPDHPEKKLVIDKMFDMYLNHPKVRFFGNVEMGTDISHEELTQWYDAVIYSVGASSDSHMGIVGEDLSGSWAAREFVAWYNGHPDYSDLTFDFSHKRAVVVGNGNVAIDVARILTLSTEELRKTDIADYAVDALAQSAIEEVVLLGRRSHFQGAFNNPELEELEHLDGVDVIVENDSLSAEQAVLFNDIDWQSQRKVNTLKKLADKTLTDAKKKITLRFLSSPIELLGTSKVEQVKVARNQLVESSDGVIKATATDEVTVLDAGLVLRAIGYRGEALKGLPFDETKGVIANKDGRVCDDGKLLPGTYATGWIKRGPRGVIGSNKKCARDTVRLLVEDALAGKLALGHADSDEVERMLLAKKPELSTKAGWQKIDRAERSEGQNQNRPRVKRTDWQEMITLAASNT